MRRDRLPLRLVEAALGVPEAATSATLARIARVGTSSLVARAIRAMGTRDDIDAAHVRDAVEHGLRHRAPGVRRAAARTARLRGTHGLASLRTAMGREACQGPRLALAWASLAAGAALDEVMTALESAEDRRVATIAGPRRVGAPTWLTAPELVRRALAQGGDDVDGLWAAAAREDVDLAAVDAAERHASRRGSLLLVEARGLLGDPRALPALRRVLRAMDDDPGHAFRARNAAAEALGRLGLPEAVPTLLQAIDAEVEDFEGRPGAGLGVQLPVRRALVGALGECGDARAVPALLAHLVATHAASGDLHIAAQVALAKVAAPDDLKRHLGGNEIVVAQLAGVFGLLGDDATLRTLAADPRPQVRRTADDARALLAG